MHQSIRNALVKIGRFDASDLDQLTGRLQHIELDKGSYLIKPGDICEQIYFLESGVLREFEKTDDSEDYILDLYVSNEWVLEQYSFTQRKPTHHYIQGLEKSTLWALDIYSIHQLIESSSNFLQLGKLIHSQPRNLRYLTNKMAPVEKYLHLLNDRPEIIQKIPLKYIASYLGMTPETLSRVRKKISS